MSKEGYNEVTVTLVLVLLSSLVYEKILLCTGSRQRTLLIFSLSRVCDCIITDAVVIIMIEVSVRIAQLNLCFIIIHWLDIYQNPMV